MNFQWLGRFLDRSIRTLYMADRDDFTQIFGEGGPHLWDKFCSKKKQEGDFICSLDNDNLTLLAKRVLEDLCKDQELLRRDNL